MTTQSTVWTCRTCGRDNPERWDKCRNCGQPGPAGSRRETVRIPREGKRKK